MPVWSRRKWLLGAAAAAGGLTRGDQDTGWSLAFRYDATRLMVFERDSTDPSTPLLPNDAQPLEHAPAGADFGAARFSEGERVEPDPFQVLSGRQGLLHASAERRIYFEDCRRHDGLRLSLDGRDASRMAALEASVFLARRTVRGPLLWNIARVPVPARLNAYERNRVEMLLEQEMRTAVRNAPVPQAEKLLKGRSERELSIQELVTEHQVRLLLVRAVWQVNRKPAYLAGATIRIQEPWTTDSIDVRQVDGETHDRIAALAALPMALETFSFDDRLHVVAHYRERDKRVYELWRRESGRWRPARARLVAGC